MTTPNTAAPSPQTRSELLLWSDCEFTGYVWEHPDHRILEIATVVTDFAFKEIDHYQSFIHCDPAEAARLIALNPVWEGYNPELPRLLVGSAIAPKVDTVDADLADMHATYFGEQKTRLVGNSVFYDLLNIQAQMPKFGSRLSHQVVDVSSFAGMARQRFGVKYHGKKYEHEALQDIRESVDELRYLSKRFDISLRPLSEA